jgi:hypothetical protein
MLFGKVEKYASSLWLAGHGVTVWRGEQKAVGEAELKQQ